MADRTALEGMEPHMLAAYSREQLGVHPAEFARLVGRTPAAISKREKGKSGLGESARLLVEIIARVVPEIVPAQTIVEALNSVAEDERTESKALLVVIRLCSASRLGREVVDEVLHMKMADTAPEEDDDEVDLEAPMKIFLRVVRGGREQLKKREWANDRAADLGTQGILLAAQLEEILGMAMAEEQREVRKSQPKPQPGDPPDGGDG